MKMHDFALVAAALSIFVGHHPQPARADWLVTKDGNHVETEGPWKVRGRMVVFTLPTGALSSMRLDDLDLEASEALTEAKKEAEAAGPEVEPEAARRPSVLVLTNRDIGKGQGGVDGPDALVDRLREAHQFKDLTLVKGLVNWQDTPEPIRVYMENQFEWLMDRRIKDIRLVEVDPGATFDRVQDGVTYEPNLRVTHELDIELIPDPDKDLDSLSLYIGTRVGSYFIAAAREKEKDFP